MDTVDLKLMAHMPDLSYLSAACQRGQPSHGVTTLCWRLGDGVMAHGFWGWGLRLGLRLGQPFEENTSMIVDKI